MQIYRELFYGTQVSASSTATDPLNLMNFALLLNKTGQWQEAVSIYEKGLPLSSDADLLKSMDGLDPRVPAPLQLAALAHVARGIEYERYGDAKEAMGEFVQAVTKVPDSALVNYYYGFGWQNLGPADRVKFGNAQQARAALRKAVQVGHGAVKKAAQKALQVAMKL